MRTILSALALSSLACFASPASFPAPFGIQTSRGGSVAVHPVADGGTTVPQGSVPLSQADLDEVKDKPLLDDIQLLTDILADVVKRENPKVQELYTRFRRYGLERAADTNNEAALNRMIKCANELSPEDALGVMKIFTLALNLVNAAETHHRLRLMRQQDVIGDNSNVGPLPQTEDSVRGTIDELLKSNLATPDEIYNKLLTQKVEIVLTAHPTEVNRKTLLRKCKYYYLDRLSLYNKCLAELTQSFFSLSLF